MDGFRDIITRFGWRDLHGYSRQCKPITQSVAILDLIKLTLKHPPAWILATDFGVYAGQWLSLVGFLPSIYQQYQVSLAVAGALTAIVAIANAVGTFGCGLLLQRGFRPQTLVQTGFATLMVCALSFYLLRQFFPLFCNLYWF